MLKEDYYFEKAEFQDSYAHSLHVAHYKLGIRDSVYFDKQYSEEAFDSRMEDLKSLEEISGYSVEELIVEFLNGKFKRKTKENKNGHNNENYI